MYWESKLRFWLLMQQNNFTWTAGAFEFFFFNWNTMFDLQHASRTYNSESSGEFIVTENTNRSLTKTRVNRIKNKIQYSRFHPLSVRLYSSFNLWILYYHLIDPLISDLWHSRHQTQLKHDRKPAEVEHFHHNSVFSR